MIPEFGPVYDEEAIFSPEDAVSGEGRPDLPAAMILGFQDVLLDSVEAVGEPVNCLGVKPRGFPWVSRILPLDHRPDSLERSGGSRSGRPRPPMPAVVVRKSKIFVITKDSVSRTTPSEQREGC